MARICKVPGFTGGSLLLFNKQEGMNMKNYLWLFVAFVATCFWTTTASAQQIWPVKAVGIHGKFLDGNDNGLPDVGVIVSGRYTSFMAFDDLGNFYWDFGDGTIYTFPTGLDIDDLDEATLSICDNPIIYSGEFNDDDVLDNGWFIEKERCYGYDFAEPRISVHLMVHESDPRYSGDDPNLIFCVASGCWEYQVASVSGSGSILD